VGQLGSEQFADREEAEVRLRWVAASHAGQFGETLRQTAEKTPSPEVRQRLTRTLAALDQPELLAEEVRAARAVEVLERIGTPAARAVLKNLASGPAAAWLTRDARDALDRFGRGR
jgi:hypothetical protein